MMLQKQGIVTNLKKRQHMGYSTTALAVASIAHPRFRDEYLKSFYDDPLFTKAKGCCPGKLPRGVTMYQDSIRLAEE